jgi:hypothetical protein
LSDALFYRLEMARQRREARISEAHSKLVKPRPAKELPPEGARFRFECGHPECRMPFGHSGPHNCEAP